MDANTDQTVHVIVDKSGRIVGAMRPSAPDAHAQVRIEPLNGQRSVEVRLPQDVRSLQTAEDFQRLVERFHVPRGKTALVPRVVAAKRSGTDKGKRPPARRRG